MAIVHQGALTSGIRGRVGDVVFQVVNGVQVVRQMPPSIQDPNTPLQQIQRSALTQAMAEWRDLDVGERAKWGYFAAMRGRLNKHRARRRVGDLVKPEDSGFFDGHNGAVAQKCREADKARNHEDVTPDVIELQRPPPYAKTKNFAPSHHAIWLAVGSLGAPWNTLAPLIDRDGLWWYMTETGTHTAGTLGRVWAQPPYPIHSQRITIRRVGEINAWFLFNGIQFARTMWARKCQVKGLTIPIVNPAPWGGSASLNIPYVWKSQIDLLDAEFLASKGSGVIRFYLPANIGEGLWQVWPTFIDILAAKAAGLLEEYEWPG